MPNFQGGNIIFRYILLAARFLLSNAAKIKSVLKGENDQIHFIRGAIMKNKKFFNKRCLVRLATFAVAFLAVLGGMAYKNGYEAKAYRIQIENNYQHSLDELYSSIQNINISLEKGIYTTTASQMSSIAADILKDATIAKASLSLLPSTGETLTALNRFFSQAGDYFASLSRKMLVDGGITDDDRSNIIALQKSAQGLSDGFQQLMLKYEDGGLWTEEATALLGDLDIESAFGGSVYELEDTFTDYPSLIYDGPFSDHILKTSPVMLTGAAEISAEEALDIAAEFLGIAADSLTRDTDENGKIPCYRFVADDLSISISKSGGFIVYYRKYRSVGEEKISYETAVDKAIDAAKKFSDATFSESYYFTDEGMCTVNLAYTQGNTVCYTDLIKVGVAMDTGEILMFESTGYIMNHTSRTVSTPAHTIAEAQAKLSDKLKVISSKEVLIPSPGSLSEYHCYEFYCTGLDNKELLVYVDTDTLEERDIILVMRTDGGTMTK